MINVVEINDPYAGMVELADASDSKSEGSNTVSVRPRLPAPKKQRASLALARCFFVSAIGQPTAIRKECTESRMIQLDKKQDIAIRGFRPRRIDHMQALRLLVAFSFLRSVNRLQSVRSAQNRV